MKNDVKDKVLAFMNSKETKELNSNEFILGYHKHDHEINWPKYSYFSFYNKFMNWPSVESILRVRRYAIKDYWFSKRTNADTEEEYKQEFKTKK